VAESDLKLNSAAFEACNRAIVISGCGRSGTTTIGQVIHSMKGVEYCFEGPTLVSLFAAMSRLRPPEWKLLYETYLYEDFLINALSGRSLNCNEGDDSSIYKVKDAAVIHSRLSKSKKKGEAVAEAKRSRIAYKVPDIVPYLKRLRSFYPGSRLVLLRRDAEDTINSIVRKKWFSSEVLKAGISIWPNRTRGGLSVPYWIPVKDIDRWIRFDEWNRAAYYYAFMTEAQHDLRDAIIVDYDRLVEHPKREIDSLAKKLGLAFGKRTDRIIASIDKRNIRRHRVIPRLEPDMKRRLAKLQGA